MMLTAPFKLVPPIDPWPPNKPWLIKDAQDREVARSRSEHCAIKVVNALNGFRDVETEGRA